jgi:hypothetical protein
VTDFDKTLHGAQVGDLYMSLIDTCELNGANPFDFLAGLQRHVDKVAAGPRGVDAVESPLHYRHTRNCRSYGLPGRHDIAGKDSLRPYRNGTWKRHKMHVR